MRFLGAFAVRMAASPRWVVSGFAVLLAASVFLSLRLQVSTDISSLMPQHSRLSAALLQAFEDFGSTDRLLLMVESARDESGSMVANRQSLKDLADQIVLGMDESGLFSSVSYRVTSEDREFFEGLRHRYPFHFHSEEALRALRPRLEAHAIDERVKQLASAMRSSPLGTSSQPSVLGDPLGFRTDPGNGAGHLGGFRLDFSDGYFFSENGASILILAEPIKPSQDTEFDSILLDQIERILLQSGGESGFLPDYSLKIGAQFNIQLIGPYVETLYGSEAAVKEVVPSIIATCLGLLALFGLVYRNVRVLVLLAVPLFAGIALISGLISIFTVYLTMITVGFATMLAGLGVDFEIHLLERFGQESRAGKGVSEALAIAFASTGRGAVAGALSTAAIFFLIATSDFGALQEFGWIMGAGILLIGVSVFALLPVLITKFPPSRSIPAPVQEVRWCRWIVSHAGSVVLAGLILTGVLAWSAASLQLTSNIYQLGPMNSAYEESKRRILEAVGGSTNVVMLVTETESLEELLQTSERLKTSLEQLLESGEIESFESLSSIFLSRESQLKLQQELGQWDLARAMEAFEGSLKSSGFRPSVFSPFMGHVLAYASENENVLGLGQLNGTPAEDWLGRFLAPTETGWRAVSYVYPRTGQWEDEVPAAIISKLESQGEGLVLTGVVPIFEEISNTVRTEFFRLTGFALIAVLLISMLFFRRPVLSVLSIVPALLGLVWTLGLMQLLGIELNLVTMLVAPMILGLGIDDALHVLNRHQEKPGELSQNLAAVSRGILMTSLTTIIGFGSLAFADLPSLRALGITVSIGMVCCAVSSLLLLPALLRAFDSRARAYQ